MHGRTKIGQTLLPLIMLLSSGIGHAQSADPTKSLSDCLVSKSTGGDRIALARWIGVGIFASPKLQDLGTVNAEKKVEVDKAAAVIFTRLITKDCLLETKSLMTQKQASPQEAFKAIGEVAMTELMTDKGTLDSIGAFAKYLNDADFKNLRP
jgi:hypothetical protein